MASYLDIAQFADPDEARGAEELIGWLLGEASDEELSMVSYGELDFEDFLEFGEVAGAVAGELGHVFQTDAAEFEVV